MEPAEHDDVPGLAHAGRSRRMGLQTGVLVTSHR